MAKKPFKEPFLLRFTRWIFPKLERVAPFLAVRLFTQLFFTPLHFGFPTKEKAWVKTSKKSDISIQGKKISVYEWGDEKNPAVIFVHGWAGRGTQFRKFFEPFIQGGYRIIAFDGPAHGKSEGKQTTVIEFEEVVRHLWNRSDPPAGIIAHSFGGTVALYAAFKGLPIQKLVMIGTPVIGELVIKGFLRAVNGSEKTGVEFRKRLNEKYGRSFEEFSAEHLLPRLPEPIDLMIIHDRDDKESPIRHAEEAVRLYPQATLMRTAGLGHNRVLRDTAVIDACLRFMKNI
jgi:pimeloyl-ACP methyl ester carboxylesterase